MNEDCSGISEGVTTDYTINNYRHIKNDRMISVRFQGKPFNITVIQVYAPTTDAKEAEVDQCYEDLQHLLELTSKKKKNVLFIIREK